jgi:hypothetical protein
MLFSAFRIYDQLKLQIRSQVISVHFLRDLQQQIAQRQQIAAFELFFMEFVHNRLLGGVLNIIFVS